MQTLLRTVIVLTVPRNTRLLLYELPHPLLQHVPLEVGVVGHLLLYPVRLQPVEDNVERALLQEVHAVLVAQAVAVRLKPEESFLSCKTVVTRLFSV